MAPLNDWRTGEPGDWRTVGTPAAAPAAPTMQNGYHAILMTVGL